jgi:hypothetical protein
VCSGLRRHPAFGRYLADPLDIFIEQQRVLAQAIGRAGNDAT